MLTLIIIVLILMAICRPRRYRGFGPYHHHHGPFFGPPMGGPRGPHGPMCGGPFDHGPGGHRGPGAEIRSLTYSMLLISGGRSFSFRRF